MPNIGETGRQVPAPRRRRPRRQRPAPVYRPSPTLIRQARTQEQGYASQGRAVERAANRQRAAAAPQPPTPLRRNTPAEARRPPAFRPALQSQAQPFKVQRERAARRTRRALDRLPDHPAIPEIPLGLYTPGQIHEIRTLYKRAARQVGGRSISDLYQVGNLRQRRHMLKVGRIVNAIETGRAADVAYMRGGLTATRDRIAPRGKPSMLQASVGAPLDAALRFAEAHTRIPNQTDVSLTDFANVPVQLTRATIENPRAVAHQTLRTAVESFTGIPQGIKAMISDPASALHGIARDYERRYGPIVNNPAEFRRRVKTESGLTPFVLDAASLGVPAGRAATLLARTGAAGRAVAALATAADANGRLRPLADFASTAHRVARAPRDARRLAGLQDRLHMATLDGDTRAASQLRKEIKHARANEQATGRPALRFSGGEGGVRKQVSSPNLIVGLGQRALDRSRRRAFEGEARRAGWTVGPGGRLIPTEGAQQGRLTALRPGEREVVPKATGVIGRSGRELPGLRRYTGRVARDVGGAQSKTRIHLLTHRGRVAHDVNRVLGRLDDNERSAMKYMLQLGATPDQAGIRILERRRDQIIAARAEHGTRIAPILSSTNDELQLINRILERPAEHLTPRARAVADELRQVQLAEARRDPELTGAQELIRRVTPQGAALGVTRGPDVGFFRQVLADIEHNFTDEHGHPLAPGVAEHADQLALMHPAERAAAAGELRRGIRRQRKRAERDVLVAERRLAAATATVRRAERRGVPYDTSEVRAARAELAAAKRDRRALGHRLARAERAAGRLSGRLGERERIGAPMVTPEVRAARTAVSVADRHANAISRELGRAEEKASRLQGRTEGRHAAGRMTEGAGRVAVDQADAVAELRAELERAQTAARAARVRLRDAEAGAPRITPAQFQARERAGTAPGELQRQLAHAEEDVAGARGDLERALADAPRASDAELRRVVTRERELAARKDSLEHVRNFERALKKVQRAAKSKRTMRLEDAHEFADKVRKAAEEEGLAAPAYWWSSLAPQEMPSLAAAGSGLRAAHRNRAYRGKLFDIGAEEHGVDVFSRGIERNIKRRFQQALVARNLETHAYEWSRGHNGEGLTVPQLQKMMIDRGIDPRSVELVEPRVLRRRDTEQPGVERGRVLTNDELDRMSEEDFISTTQQDLAEGRRTWEEVTRMDLKQQALHRYLAVPKEIGETLNGVANRMDNTFWRGMEIVLKQKPARILLGAANIPWLAFQIASNAMLTGLGGGVNPFNVYGAHKWWRGLTADEREAVEAELGVTHGHHFGLDQTYLGATNSRMVNFWRGYKKSRVGRNVHKANVLDIMFRADEAQNNFFRRVLFYDRSRKAAYRRMGHNWKGIHRSMDHVMERVLAKPPHQQAALIARHGAEFEKVAKHVNDFLGDYVRFTPAERFLLQRNVMFYGYLRFSLRFAFYTMPVGHPIMANILGNIGRLGASEIKDLMGVPENYQLPTSMLTQTYFGSRRDAKRNELRSLPLGRFNPFLNAVTQLDGLQQAVGLVSPLYQIVADQMFEESSFTGRDWRIEGRPTPSESDRPRNYFGSAFSALNPTSPRGRIALAEALRLAYPYRVATATGIPGVVDPLAPNQSDDALLGSPRPMMYADKEAAAGVRKSRTDYAAQGFGRHLAEQLLPVFPRRTSAPAVVARELEREASIRARNARKPGERKKRRRRRRAGTGDRYGGGRYSMSSGSSGSRYGG